MTPGKCLSSSFLSERSSCAMSPPIPIVSGSKLGKMFQIGMKINFCAILSRWLRAYAPVVLQSSAFKSWTTTISIICTQSYITLSKSPRLSERKSSKFWTKVCVICYSAWRKNKSSIMMQLMNIDGPFRVASPVLAGATQGNRIWIYIAMPSRPMFTSFRGTSRTTANSKSPRIKTTPRQETRNLVPKLLPQRKSKAEKTNLRIMLRS